MSSYSGHTTPLHRKQNGIASSILAMEEQLATRCRTCLVQEQHESLMFSLNDSHIREMFRLTSIKHATDDAMPQFLCARCYRSCLEWNNFYAMALSTDQHLRSSETKQLMEEVIEMEVREQIAEKKQGARGGGDESSDSNEEEGQPHKRKRVKKRHLDKMSVPWLNPQERDSELALMRFAVEKVLQEKRIFVRSRSPSPDVFPGGEFRNCEFTTLAEVDAFENMIQVDKKAQEALKKEVWRPSEAARAQALRKFFSDEILTHYYIRVPEGYEERGWRKVESSLIFKILQEKWCGSTFTKAKFMEFIRIQIAQSKDRFRHKKRT